MRAAACAVPLAPSCAEEPFRGWSRITGGVGGDINGPGDSKEQGNLEVEFFRPVTNNSRALSFIDVRALGEADETVEFDVNFGARSILGAGNFGLGINGGAGYGRNDDGTDALRGAFGLEAFNRIFDARVTGYLATDSRISSRIK